MSSMRRYLLGRSAAAEGEQSPESKWFWDHYELAAGEIASFCEACSLSFAGSDVADIGCGDGIMALGFFNLAGPKRLVGFDIVETNREVLLTRARAEGVARELPAELEFKGSSSTATPAADGEFDFVYSWSAFEHIADPISVLCEIRRILKPTGHFFLQLWPFYYSAKGSHLWDWFDEDYHHLLENDRDIVAQLNQSDSQSADWAAYMTREFEHLNRITLDELQRALLAAGFDVRRLELLASPTILTPPLARYSWSDLGISGIKLLATPHA